MWYRRTDEMLNASGGVFPAAEIRVQYVSMQARRPG